jgi:DNA primase
VIIATDADTAGRTAAERDYWQLTAWGINPTPAHLPEGSDPASILTGLGPTTLERILDKATPAASQMINQLITGLPPDQAVDHATRILAASPPSSWQSTSTQIAQTLGVDIDTVRATLARHVDAWNANPRRAATHSLIHDTDTRHRLRNAEHGKQSPPTTGRVDPTLVGQAGRIRRPEDDPSIRPPRRTGRLDDDPWACAYASVRGKLSVGRQPDAPERARVGQHRLQAAVRVPGPPFRRSGTGDDLQKALAVRL